MGVLEMSEFKPRLPHFDADGSRFVRPSDCASIIVREHHHRQAHQRGAEHPLARDIKIVAVDEREHWTTCRLCPKALDACGDYAPNHQGLTVPGHDVWVGRIRRLQADVAPGAVEPFDREIIVHHPNNDVAVDFHAEVTH